MEKQIFEYLDYKRYLAALIQQKPAGGRGFRARLAEATGVQRTFLSQVLKNNLHFSLEQAERLSRFLGHSLEETTFFMLQVQYARAGTEELRKLFLDQMKKVTSHRLIITNRLKNEKTLSYENEARYYSRWYHQAIRCAVSVPSLRTAEALSKRLELSLKATKESLTFLELAGLVNKNGAHYHPGARHIHLSDDSTIRVRRHTSWLLRSLSALEDQGERDLHFSSVLTLSEEDALAIKSMIVEYIEKIVEKAKPSPEETLYSFCLGYFEL
jgi:uncharacterized protein (TIGR02147 family)